VKYKSFCFRFRKNKSEQIIRDQKEKSKEAIRIQIEKRIQEGPIPVEEISEFAKSQTAAELNELLLPLTKRRLRAFDLVGIEQEVTALNERLIEIQIKQAQIGPILIPRTNSTDKDIEELERFLQKHDNKRGLVLSAASREKLKSRFDQFDRFFQERMLVKIYRIREEERKREQDVKKQQLKELISKIENLINQSKFQEAKSQISKAYDGASGLRDTDLKKSFREKLEMLKTKLREGQTREETKRQEIKFKKQQDKEDRQRLEREAEHKKEREKKKSEVCILDDQGKNVILENYGITGIFHMTDISNLERILLEGLLSHTEAHARRFVQRDISDHEVNDRRSSREPINNRIIHDYVPFYFNPRNPMLYRRKDWQDTIVILEFDKRLLYQKNALFTNGNAASNATKFYNDLGSLKNINWEIVRGSSYWTDFIDGKRIKCAEVLVYPKGNYSVSSGKISRRG
jgi:hypothetical protein